MAWRHWPAERSRELRLKRVPVGRDGLRYGPFRGPVAGEELDSPVRQVSAVSPAGSSSGSLRLPSRDAIAEPAGTMAATSGCSSAS